uniref:Cytosine specific methyltransferase n=1 Tax=Podoviridae sp. ctxOS2 TaxID=2826590 RepID=A0A8S5MB41_9CAUD|nr:MAG TPA: Cytosine specific methyltransferase [Podoviridae sp. ctxOS2]
METKIERKHMKFIDFFSGIGGFHTGLEKAGMECIGWCEFDKFAQASYRAMYDTDNLWFGDDVTKVKGKDLPKADLWTFGFPCQDISIAGKQKGIKEGTRSGLFYEIMRLLDECKENKPQWIMCENVKNLLSIDGGGGFLTVVGEMAERGYCIEWKVYNSKDYGVPQNRERVYIVGCYGKRRSGNLLPVKRENTTTLKQIIGGSQGERVYNPNGVSCTLSAQGGGMGAKTGLYEIDTNKVQSIGNGSRYETDNTVWPTGLAGTLTATDYKHVPKVAIKNATKQGYTMAEIGDGIDLAYPDSETRRGRVQPQRSNTLTTSDNLGVLVDDEPIRIRKLTPKECWRLQGFTDEQYEKAATVNSNSQLYKQAGNAVTVNVVEEIGKHIMKVNAYGGDDEKRYIG